MTPTSRTRWTAKELALTLVTLTCICALIFLSHSLARPFPNADLGAEWQCSKTLFLTTCTRIPQTPAAFHGMRKDANCLRRA
jgi:hypothetical protein